MRLVGFVVALFMGFSPVYAGECESYLKPVAAKTDARSLELLSRLSTLNRSGHQPLSGMLFFRKNTPYELIRELLTDKQTGAMIEGASLVIVDSVRFATVEIHRSELDSFLEMVSRPEVRGFSVHRLR